MRPGFDGAAFARDINALRAELDADLGEEDLAHFRRMERWGRACSIAGWATAWIAPNPLSAGLISLGTTARWTIVGHHVSHRGLDRLVPASKEGPLSTTFGRGFRRLVDWLDWMTPEAWGYEHNVLHHYRTGELEDPDLLEENIEGIRTADIPRALKWVVVGFYACTWKLSYYAPNTFLTHLRSENEKRARRGETVREVPLSAGYAFDPRSADGRSFWRSILPYALTRFVAAPLAFLPLGPVAAANVLANSLGAEVLTNLHTFWIIAPNHSGDDLYRFETKSADKSEFYVRQVIGSANYTSPNALTDFLQGFLNYQIEHHLWPDLPPRKYRQAAPRVRAICERHGVPYVEETVFQRGRRLLSIMLGDKSMRRTSDACSIDTDDLDEPLSWKGASWKGAAE